MNQIGNIFRKDFRHHWREVVASLMLLIGFAWVEIREWSENVKAFGIGAGAGVLLPILSQLIVPLVPISWMFLVVRAIQGESLVGDRQFWVTRPYDWKKLLVTKIAFVLGFVNIPLFLLDTFLLAKAGFRPTSYLVGLLWLQMFWAFVILLPTAALATVTASIGQMLLALLFVVLYFISMAALASAVPNSSFSENVGPVYFLLVMATALVVILLQYSRRKTAVSRWLIAGLGTLVVLVIVLTPYRTLILHAYPLVSSTSSPLQISLLPAKAPDPEHAMKMGEIVPLRFPVSVSGMSSDSFVSVTGTILTLTNGQGEHWDSGWLPRGTLLFPDQKTTDIDLYAKLPVFDKFKSTPVHVRLLLAFDVFRDKDRRPMVVPRGEFVLPEVGVCSAKAAVSNPLTCRLPLRGPEFLLFTSDLATNTCPSPKGQTRPQAGSFARGSMRYGSAPVEPGISPVLQASVYLSGTSTATGICPGTPLILSNPEQIGRGRIELDLGQVSLPDYQQSSAQNP